MEVNKISICKQTTPPPKTQQPLKHTASIEFSFSLASVRIPHPYHCRLLSNHSVASDCLTLNLGRLIALWAAGKSQVDMVINMNNLVKKVGVVVFKSLTTQQLRILFPKVLQLSVHYGTKEKKKHIQQSIKSFVWFSFLWFGTTFIDELQLSSISRFDSSWGNANTSCPAPQHQLLWQQE